MAHFFAFAVVLHKEDRVVTFLSNTFCISMDEHRSYYIYRIKSFCQVLNENNINIFVATFIPCKS